MSINGDQGLTNNFSGGKLPKNHPLINLIGNLDELNAYLALVRFVTKYQSDFISQIQQQIQISMSQISGYNNNKSIVSAVNLDQKISEIKKLLPPQTEFVIFGDQELPIFINICRTVCRRAERSCLQAGYHDPEFLAFINRLSSYLYYLSLYFLHKKTQ